MSSAKGSGATRGLESKTHNFDQKALRYGYAFLGFGFALMRRSTKAKRCSSRPFSDEKWVDVYY